MKRKSRKLLSLLLSVLMLLNMGVTSVFAEELITYQVKVISKQGGDRSDMTYTISNPTPTAGELVTVTVVTTRAGSGTAGIDFYDNKTWQVITIPGYEIKRSYDNPNQFTFIMPPQDVNLQLRAEKKHTVQTVPFWQPEEGAATPASLDGSIPAVPYTEKGKKLEAMFSAWDSDNSEALLPDGFLTQFEGGVDYGTIDCSGDYLTYTPNAAAAGKTIKFYVKGYIGGGVATTALTFTAVVGNVPDSALSQDATLKTLAYSVDGNTAISIPLQKGRYDYDVALPFDTAQSKTIVLIGESNHAAASITGKTDATTSYIKQESSLTVQAEDSSATQVYTVNFTIQAPDTPRSVSINGVNYTNNDSISLEAGQEYTLGISIGAGASGAGSCSYTSSNYDKVSVGGAFMGFYPNIFTSDCFTLPVCKETITINFYEEATTDHRNLSPIETITLNIRSTQNISVKINDGEEVYGKNLQNAVEMESGISPENITSLEITAGNLDYQTDMNYLLGVAKTNLTNLASLVISNAVTDNFPYGNLGLFQYWESLETATVGFTSLDDMLFLGCTALENAIFPRATSIASDAFEDCDNLKTMGLPATPPTMTGKFIGIPKNVVLVPVAEDGTPLSGTDLENAKRAYQIVNDGNTTDDTWYGLDLAYEYNITLTTGLGYTLTGGTDPVQHGEDYTFTFVLADGYTKTDAFSVKINDKPVTLKEDGSYTILNVTENQTITIEGVADTIAPTGEIAIGENKWTSFLNTITFGVFFKETQTVNLTATDLGSGVDKIYYHLSEIALTENEVKALGSSSWTEGKSKEIAPNWKGVVYAKLTDKAGNISYFSSDGLVFYAESTVTPTNAEFCKAVAKQADVTITMTLNNNTLRDIQNGTAMLQKDRDYTVDDATVTLKKAYLSTLPAGIATLKFNFNPMGAVGSTVSSTDVKITITDPISYGVWVGGVVITEDNATDILENGTVSYAPATETLTLNNATIVKEERQHFAIYAPAGCNLKVVLEGTNSIMVEGGGIYAEDDLTLSGTGMLTVNVEKHVPISAGGDLTIDGIEIGAFSDGDGAITANGKVIIQKGATVTAGGTLYGLASVGDLLLSDSIVDASATGELRNAISSEQQLTIENASEIMAESHGPALFSKESLVLSDSTIHATSKNDLGIYTLSDLTITSGELYAKGGIGKAAIGARVVQENAEEPTPHIILGAEMKDESFAKVAVSSWYTSSGEQKSWTSFVAKEDTAPLATNLSNAVNEVTIKSHTHAYGDWIADLTNHWKECACGEISGKTAHTPEADDGDCTTASLCSVCGTETPEAKEHDYKTEWSKDNTNHWHDCNNENCTVKGSVAAHTPGDAATIEHAQVCTVCDYIIAEKLPSKNEITDGSTGISVKYEDGSAFDSTVTLSVTSKPQSEMDKFKDSIDKAAPVLVLGGLYDIKLLKDGVAIQPNGKIRVSIPLTENMKSMTDLKVVYIDDNGKVTIIPSEVKDGMIAFVTDHFSYYGVIGKVKAADSENNSGNGTNSPHTGDDSNLPLMVAVLLLAGGTLITLLIKRKKPKND